ncbi:MAG TPA: PH domain-containing protein [Povalibacter sp.]|nr:PH domain-containing protein [Povalibacter sp.]
METQHVSPGAIGAWRSQAVIGTAAAALVAAGLLRSQADFGWLLLAIALITALAASWIWPPLYYRHLRYGVDVTGIVIERGVLWRSRIALPRVRIQHTDVSQGPLQRRFGVGTLKLYTAGSRHTMIVLPGLDHADAIALRDALLAENVSSGV